MPLSDNTPPDEHSKTQRKQEMLALQKIGETLVRLPEAQLKKIPLEPVLAKAIDEARLLTSREAIRRQLQYIGRLMRHVDPKPIYDALEKIHAKSQKSKAQFHKIERWRDKLIADGDTALADFLTHYPDIDRQQLRQLVRNAQQTKKGADTALFRYLREIIEYTS